MSFTRSYNQLFTNLGYHLGSLHFLSQRRQRPQPLLGLSHKVRMRRLNNTHEGKTLADAFLPEEIKQ